MHHKLTTTSYGEHDMTQILVVIALACIVAWLATNPKGNTKGK
ncbi:hypothetical protein [Ferrimonas balearica]|nr:hypothetical protein [Ferrimonas balearica]